MSQTLTERFMEAEQLLFVGPLDAEPRFTGFPCDCCDDPDSGNRYDLRGYCPRNKQHYNYVVCERCYQRLMLGE